MFGDRLKQALDEEAVSPAQFADTIGVNRSAVSHVMNDRNKPGYDFIQKIQRSYPHWDFDWLVFEKPKRTQQRSATDANSTASYKSPEKPKEILPGNENKEIQRQYQQASLFTKGDEAGSNASPLPARVQRSVIKTILIYSDGTFEIYQPSQK
jgi:transcriptional regulator with XRE-family HTH domain